MNLSFAPHRGLPGARLELLGHSGCDVRIDIVNGQPVVVKSAVGRGPADRLRLQMSKQMSALEANTLSAVRIPAVISERSDADFYEATMEYVYYESALQCVSKVSLTGLQSVAEIVDVYIREQLKVAVFVDAPTESFEAKLDEISRRLTDQGSFEQYDGAIRAVRTRLDRVGAVAMPCAVGHGDLTFSNIMIASDCRAIGLIDFLDSFIDSPLIDLAKLRQDTRFCWTALMVNGTVDVVRFVQTMGYLDRYLETSFGVYDWYRSYMPMMMSLTLLRIAPYATSAEVHKFLQASLATVAKDD